MSCLTMLGLASGAGLAQVDRARGGVASGSAFASRYALNSADPANLTWVPDPAGSARPVMRVRVRDTDDKVFGGLRTEISPLNEYIRDGVRWYALSMYFPADWEFHPYPVVVGQLHTSQKATIVSPPVSFVAHGRSLDLELHHNHRSVGGSDPVTKANSASQTIRLDKLRTQTWYCFVVRADWSFTPGQGSLRIWMNGDKVYEALNSYNAYETWLGNWPKVGLYHPGAMGVHERTLYVDYVYVGGQKSGFDEMSALTPCSGHGAAPETK
ncbi:MAG: heparin lyase I family protein [Sterolibacteriaceae bacterium]|uniref:Heparin lyase I family protein n=1 Tax=Candidatus Methylophosphatis roskildensis TaxID=2899263 RepID=A0A9D7E1H2_9PROT|nr:heparin lyase I family protein [Candidatus Methylophosphatis roskildensis]